MSFQRRASAFDLARRAGVRYVGANSADSSEDYMASGTYAPTLTVTGTGAASLTTSALGWCRIGNPGGAAAGDTYIVFGIITLTGMADGDIVNIPLDVAADLVAAHGGPAVMFDTTMTGSVRLVDADTAAMDIGVTGDDTGVATFSITYQTA